MTATQKQFDEFAAKWADSFNVAYKANAAGLWVWSAQEPSSRYMAKLQLSLAEHGTELERQLRIIDDITVKHAETLRALADR